MHRLIGLVSVGVVLGLAACGGGKKDPQTPPKDDGNSATSDADAGASTASTGDGGAPKADVCTGFSMANLEDLLAKSDCEAADVNQSTLANPDLKGKLEVTLTASPTKAAPGSKVDLMVTFTNKTKDPMPLYFKIDPLARFEVEAYDAKGKNRVDMPKGNPPPPPKGQSAPPPGEVKTAKVTLAANGFASVRVPWDATKMKWAPDKVRGTASEKGYPRVPAGPLPKGKYVVKVVTPLIGVFEGGEHEVSAPKVEIEVGN